MSRLFYEPELAQAATDRSGAALGNQPTRAANPPAPQSKVYLEKVAKLVPAEIVAAYISMLGFVEVVDASATRDVAKWSVFGICLVCVPFYLNSLSDKSKPPVGIHLFLSTVAFVIWAYAISGRILINAYFDPAIASISLIAFTLVSGVIPLTPKK